MLKVNRSCHSQSSYFPQCVCGKKGIVQFCAQGFMRTYIFPVIRCSYQSKAEHGSGLPAAHYRYTCGKTCEYVNSQIQVTQWLKPTQIQVGLPEYQVLVPSTILISFATF